MLTKPGWDAGRDRHPCAAAAEKAEEEEEEALQSVYDKIRQNFWIHFYSLPVRVNLFNELVVGGI